MSDNYRALTRTYRPTTFDDIVSQRHVSDTLKNAIKQQRLAHAYMFCGPRGVGKTTMARVLARTVNEIDSSVDGEGLNQTLNIVEIDAASNNKVDDIRDLRERVRIPPQNGRYKIYIVDEVHMLSKSAFNALLKTLEEPPDHVIFIFATTEPHKVLPTILSRVQRFDFKRISVDEIVERLQQVAKDEGISIDVESLHVIAKKADGALRDALGLLDQAIAFCGDDIDHDELLRALNVVSTDRMFQFMDTVESHDAGSGLELINELLQEGHDIQEFLVGLLEHLRNLYVAKNSEKMHLVEASAETKKRYQQAAGPFSQDDLMRMMHLVSEAQYKIKEAQQPHIQFELTLLKLIHMERSENLNTLLSELDALKKKLSNVDGGTVTREPEAADRKSDSEKSDSSNNSTERAAESGGEGPEPDPRENVEQGVEESRPVEPDREHEEPDEQEGTEPVGSPQTSVSEPVPMTPEPEPESHASQPKAEHEEVAVVEEDETEDENNFFGQPSLGGFKNSSPGNGNNGNGVAAEQKKPDPKPKVPKKENITLEEVKDSWDDYLKTLKSEVPQTLYFQMQRIEPVALKNRELTLRCTNDFAKRILDENKRLLAKVLDSVVGIFLRFNTVVQKNEEEEKEESKSPYERFKDLQERDPKIKMLVELFGAELDYNLNR
ncbi:DNA polymerase III subunit gamma/tau [Aliifodinibius sp. S!AR15-10]|uniref:DNA polymerase III subunit gamma/tau n=1 Tax=Aliifodinibius sp. S!AR15-10 TaxID=2950437 RepID=UPI002862C704|nr:DNA polymerase III subunit gamma/tau [Aliifodinibius sp. S!AR15-10]MDR8391331.1 DNA polymerase III subunit gamma/tau [Aliifodinibius sp. S!AR15-10]